MNFSEIKVQHLYFILFEPTKDGEFGGKHLSLILKKNNDKKTLLVLPLTSNSSGNTVNKVNLGILPGLPKSLSGNTSYAVFNQSRTVSYKRVTPIMDGASAIDYKLSNDLYNTVFKKFVMDVSYNYSYFEKKEIFKDLYFETLKHFLIEKIYDLTRNYNSDDIIKCKNIINQHKYIYSDLVKELEGEKNINFLKILDLIVDWIWHYNKYII